MATGGWFTKSDIEASDAVYDFPCSPCCEEGKNTEALLKCVECDCFYCQRCLDVHSRFVKNHTIQDIKAIKAGQHTKSQPLTAPPVSIDEICKAHHGKIKDMFCQQHDKVCCAVCIALNHKSCEAALYIPKVAKDLLKGQDVEKVKSNLEQLTTDLRNLKSKQNEFLKSVDKQRGYIIKSIHQHKAYLLQRIDDLERSSVKEAEKICKAISNDINHDILEVEEMLNDVRIYLNKLTNESCDDDSRVFVSIKEAERQTLKVNECKAKLCREPEKQIRYNLDKRLEECLKQMKYFGNMNASSQTKAPFVNILVPRETRPVQFFIRSLKSDLLEIGIPSQFIHPSEMDHNVHTVVVFNNPYHLRRLDVESQHYGKMILLQLENKRGLIQSAMSYYGLQDNRLPSWADDAKIIRVHYTDSGKADRDGALKKLLDYLNG